MFIKRSAFSRPIRKMHDIGPRGDAVISHSEIRKSMASVPLIENQKRIATYQEELDSPTLQSFRPDLARGFRVAKKTNHEPI
jgi:hypothetical protein